MRLLDLQQPFLTPPENIDAKARSYVILSHTWRDEEVSFNDLKDLKQASGKKGWAKIQSACELARKDGYRYIWIDTCCIDKSSSSELTECINSMYRWYQQAVVCYAYLDDLDSFPQIHTRDKELVKTFAHEAYVNTLQQCRWFTRGWTLQELVAPRRVVFFSRTWNVVGDQSLLSNAIAEITGIDREILQDREDIRGEQLQLRLKRYSAAQIFSWAARRQTTRVEDRAYSMLGLLDINLDARYGEGTKAFIRLQEELILRSTDQSLFAWNSRSNASVETDEIVFASWPDWYQSAGNIVAMSSDSFRLSNQGLHLSAQCTYVTPDVLRVWLRCKMQNDPSKAVVLNVSIDRDVQVEEHDLFHDKRQPIACRPMTYDRISFVDVYEMITEAKPLYLVMLRTPRRMYTMTSRPTVFVWARFPERKVPVLNLAASSPPASDACTWMLPTARSQAQGMNAIIMTLATERTKLAELQLQLKWDQTERWVHAELSTQFSTDLEKKRAELLESMKSANVMHNLEESIEVNVQIEESRTLHVVIRKAVANEETMVVFDITHRRSMELLFDKKDRDLPLRSPTV